MADKDKLTPEQKAFRAKMKASDIKFVSSQLATAKQRKAADRRFVKAGIMDPDYNKARIKEGKAALRAVKRQSTNKVESSKVYAAKQTAANLNKFIDRPSDAKKSAVTRMIEGFKGGGGRGGRIGGLGALRGGGGVPRVR
jgi:hypothetical protein